MSESSSPAPSQLPEVIMYSTRVCGYCERARALLERKKVAYREIKIDEDPAHFAIMLQRSAGRRTVPQIFIGERHVGGFMELAQLDRTGELDRLLGFASSGNN
jgi:glutaredoxin 3